MQPKRPRAERMALALNHHRLAVATKFSVIVIGIIAFYKVFLNRNYKSSLLKLYDKLPKQNQLLVTAVANAQKQGNPTTGGIAIELEKLANTQIDREPLRERLQDVENAGLIEKILVNREDRASFAWRNLLTTRSIF